LQRGFRKRASSNPDQDGSRKKRKVAQIKGNQSPEITASSQADTDLGDLLPPAMADTDREDRFVERSRGIMEMRWAASRRNSGSHSDGKGSDNEGGDEEEGEDGDEDEENKDDDDGDEDEDEDEDAFYESEVPGISNWDLLGEDHEREAATLGLFSSYEFPTQLTTL